jgi:NTE family protein
MEKNFPFENLVFEGGGVKGIAYAGALGVLEAYKIMPRIERVAGTSAGAIMACLVALRYDADAIHGIMQKVKLPRFEDSENIFRKFWNYGLHPGDYFLGWMRDQIAGANLGLRPDATFRDFQQAGCLHLQVYSCDIYDHSLQELSVDVTPDTIVAEAVRASMSIPIFFNAWQFSNKQPNDHLFVDGGTVYNYPITAFDTGSEPNYHTLGFRLQDKQGLRPVHNFGKGHWVSYVKNVFETLLETQNIDFNQDQEQKDRSVIIDDLGIPTTDFKINRQQEDDLVKQGQIATDDFLAKWEPRLQPLQPATAPLIKTI